MHAVGQLVGLFHTLSTIVCVGLVAFTVIVIFIVVKCFSPDWDGN